MVQTFKKVNKYKQTLLIQCKVANSSFVGLLCNCQKNQKQKQNSRILNEREKSLLFFSKRVSVALITPIFKLQIMKAILKSNVFFWNDLEWH
jgi:hypothetical protein